MNWDWYQATFRQGPDELLPVLQDAYGALNRIEETAGRHSYRHGAEIRDSDEVLARVWWGGINGDGCHVQMTGQHAPHGVAALRERFPSHRVSRVDVKEDYTGEHMWERLSTICLSLADELRIKVDHAGDHHRAIEGRSLYFGAKTSPVRALLYEKGKQLGADPNWCRVEVRCRPKTMHKEIYSLMDPAECFRSSSWTGPLAERLGMPEVDQFKMPSMWRPSDDERAMQYMLRQYGKLLTRQQAKLETWENVGVFIGQQLAKMVEADQCVKAVRRNWHAKS